jgi:hypothetical protein
MSLRRRETNGSRPERYRPSCTGKPSAEPAGLSELLEAAILCSLAPDDTTRRAYLRHRWQGRAMGTAVPERASLD